MARKRIISIACRSVGPGGTTVAFYQDKNKVIGVWTNENCPYLDKNEAADENEAAPDGHNVSELSYPDLMALAELIDNLRKGKVI